MKLIHLSHSVTFSLTYLRHCFISFFCGIFKFPTYFCHHLIVTFTYLFEKLFVDPNVCFIKRLFLFSRNLFCTWRKWMKFQVHRSTMNQKTIKLQILTVYLLWLFDVLQHHVFQISFLNLFRFKLMKLFVVFWKLTSDETFKA